MELSVEKLKALLGITEEGQDAILAFILADIEELILNYCNLSQLPSRLINTAYRMAIDLYRAENIGESEANGGEVASISEGGASVSFNVSRSSEYTSSLLKQYESTLKEFRRLKW